MAESTSPPISRSSHKPLEYTSCIDTTLSSTTPISTCGNINAHSSFDFISQPGGCDSLGRNHPNKPHRILERDLCRLDLNSNKYPPIELSNKKLDRTESISLPTTPIEQISSPFNHQCHPNNDEKHFRLTASTDYIIAPSEHLTDESISNSKR